MRFSPAAGALCLLLATSASVGHADNAPPDPRAAALLEEGRAALASGNISAATDAFEAALAVDPAYMPTLLDLALAARKNELQGKAIRYYREILNRDPGNLAAIAGEGEAMAEKGALEKARRNLAKLKSMCGDNCNETLALKGSIARTAQPKVAASETEPVKN